MINIIEEGPAYLLADLSFTKANFNTSDQVKVDLVHLLSEHNKIIILDLKELNYADSAFWGSLVSAYKFAVSIQQSIVLTGLKTEIRELIKMIRLDRVFRVYNNTEEALSAVR